MKYYVRPTVDGENFTAGKLYEIQHCFGTGRVIVLNDAKEETIVRCDGIVSARLDWRGKFDRVNIPGAQEAMESAQSAAEYMLKVGIGRHGGWQHSKIGQVTISDGQIYASASPRNEYVEVLEQLREILRVPEGENILTHAKVVRVLADGLINLQKTK
ncbi:hypothetical protein bas10_0082 [Escherichia phage IsaakIselin]|uniref:Uncharacterized protein n=1 Tax=Escherichia phage IsaakIselin TaxID=2851974 RepID=A0AAE7VTW2_9CAUD|nr:hypothetical protein bas10_0082 [Escherichia phage IsaakIselin]